MATALRRFGGVRRREKGQRSGDRDGGLLGGQPIDTTDARATPRNVTLVENESQGERPLDGWAGVE